MLFPWPGLFEQYALADTFVHLDDAQYSKGSFTNRIQLKFPDQRRWMTVPLASRGTFKKICHLEAKGHEWKSVHRQQLRDSLRGAPYIDDALAILDSVYNKETLCDILIDSIEKPAAYLGLTPKSLIRSSSLGIGGKSWQRVLNTVHEIGGDRYLTGHGAANYLDHAAFEAADVSVDYMDYSLTTWPQGESETTPYVSILDLIARVGPEAGKYIHPRRIGWREFMKQHQV